MQVCLKRNRQLANGSLHLYFFTKEDEEMPLHLNLQMFNYQFRTIKEKTFALGVNSPRKADFHILLVFSGSAPNLC